MMLNASNTPRVLTEEEIAQLLRETNEVYAEDCVTALRDQLDENITELVYLNDSEALEAVLTELYAATSRVKAEIDRIGRKAPRFQEIEIDQ